MAEGRSVKQPPEGGSNASEVLRAATADRHHQVESSIDWSRYFSSAVHYRDFLNRWLHTQRPADAQVEDLLGHYPALATRRTWRSLAADLAWLDADLPADPSARPCTHADTDFAWVTSSAQAAGVVYVFEGSTMGSLGLQRMAGRQLGVTAGAGGDFLAAYGANTVAHWRATQAWLDGFLLTGEAQSQAIEAALQTFSIVGACLEVQT